MNNERNTENIVRELLRKTGYYKSKNIIVEEQRSKNPSVQKLLKNSSKSGKGIGCPEFIIRDTTYLDFIIIIECKADTKYHKSDNLTNYKDFAVDGILNYASYLSKNFNVICVAVSGETKRELKISSYLWVKNENIYKELKDKHDKDIQEILSFKKYVEFALIDKRIEIKRFNELISFSKELHNFMRDRAKISEQEKPLLVSGVLIALMNNAFSRSYKYLDQKTELAEELLSAIGREIRKATIPKAKKESIILPYTYILNHPELRKFNKVTNETPLYRIINDIDEHVKPFINEYGNFDVIGHFYGEFLRYTGGDKKGLGIVLTPKHITELFAKLANLTNRTVVLDICAGTGGFLISSMFEMFSKTKNETERDYIKSKCLYGIEQQPNMFALAASNMILRGDGKANLFQGDCFDIVKHKTLRNIADVGMINPPYSQKEEDLKELNFVDQMLWYLKKNALGIAVVKMSCAISPSKIKDKILKNHRLEAVMSLPDDIFHPIGVVPCIMVFKAHVPHEENPYHKTWFGYWKNDGYIKTKHLGRIDGGNWKEIEERWLDGYFNRKEIPGLSVMKKVSSKEEWCAEAYLETNYENIADIDFIEEMKKFISFRIHTNNDIK